MLGKPKRQWQPPHRALPEASGGAACPLLPRGSRDASPAAPATSPGPPLPPPSEGFPNTEAGRGRARSRPLLPQPPCACKSSGGGEKRRGGDGKGGVGVHDTTASPRPAPFSSSSAAAAAAGSRDRRPAAAAARAARREPRGAPSVPAARRAVPSGSGPEDGGGRGEAEKERGLLRPQRKVFVCECRRGAGLFALPNSCHIICTGCKQPSPYNPPSPPPRFTHPPTPLTTATELNPD